MEKSRVWKFGDNVDTDQIIASQYLLVADPKEMLGHVFESCMPDFADDFRSGDVIAGKKNFGCGSSREQAALVLKLLGVRAVIAESFGRIFFRNAVNLGLPVIVCPQAAQKLAAGDEIEIGDGEISVGGNRYAWQDFPENIKAIMDAGGLIEFINRKSGAASVNQVRAGKKHNGMKRPMTLTEKILARAAGEADVSPGEIVTVPVDCLMTNDATTHVSIDIFNNRVENKKVAHPERVVLVVDHNVPAESVATARVQNMMRAFAREHNLALHDGEGVCHEILAQHYVRPGDIVIGADSHTPASGAFGAFAAGVGSTDFVGALVTGGIWLRVPETLRVNITGTFAPNTDARDLMLHVISRLTSAGALYMAMEFGGSGVKNIPFDERMTMCAMAVEAGVKNAVIAADGVTMKFLADGGRQVDANATLEADPDASYAKSLDVDLEALVPMTARPHFVHQGVPAKECQREKIRIHEAFVGSCSAGRISALRRTAKILAGRKVHPEVKMIITPASRVIMSQALGEGLIEIFLQAGAMVMNPNCSVCWGACQGVLGPGEVMISTGTRNFRGRAGSRDSHVYLGSAETVAASAIAGYIVDPRG